MKSLSALIVTLVSCLAFGSAPIEDVRPWVVKIVSKIAGTSNELRGSGLLFSKDGKTYVLTSDHVVAHVNGATFATHEARNSVTGTKHKLKFLGAEWGLGLALMEVERPGPILASLPYDTLIQSPSFQVGDTAAYYGYPFESEDLTEETHAKVLSKEAAQPYFVFVPKLYEFEAAVGEFGMSGGPAFSTDNKFLGVLAYQRILTGSTDNENRVYAIPHEKVASWLAHYFSQKEKYLPIFSEPWWAQGKPDQFILTNDGYFYAFRVVDGLSRMVAGRMESLLFLKDGPSVRYDDKKGILKRLREDFDKNPLRPGEYSLVDRSTTPASIVPVRYPATAFVELDRPGVSLLLVRGETHEQRFARFDVAVKALEKEIGDLKAPEVSALMERLKAIPAKSTKPGGEGPAEFFSSIWVSTTILEIEKVSALQTKLAPSLTKLVESLDVYEIR